MSDEAPRSDLAKKALAQRVKRDRLAEEAAQKQRAAEVRAEDVLARWKHISARILETANNINEELTNTGTALVTSKETDDAAGRVVGGHQISITRDGKHTPSQQIILRFSKDGTLNSYEHFGAGKEVTNKTYAFEGLDNVGINALIREFVDKALT